jgi:hypothetical protein
MSTASLSRGPDEFRAASGLASWQTAHLTAGAEPGPDLPRGPGLFEVTGTGGERFVTNVRRLAGTDRTPGSALIAVAAWLLALIGAAALYVSFTAQQKYVFAARHQNVASIIEALLLDLLMLVFTLLALGLSRAGKSSRTERALILACAAASAYMNVSAADTASPRSVVAYAVAPVALAVVVDRVVAVIRRHVLADDEASAWTALGHLIAVMARLAGVITLYSLRFALAPPSTAVGLRRWVLQVTPIPAAEPAPQAIDPPPVTEPPELEGATKRARLAWWYERDAAYGERTAVAAAAKRLAPLVGLGEGTARAYLGQIVAELEQARRAS